MKKIPLLISLIVPAILIANFTPMLSGKLGNPIISWPPEFIEEKISPGETSEINVVFESEQDLQNIELWLTPELRDFVTFTPKYFDSVSINAKNFVRLEISVPAEASLGIYNGTLHVRAGKRTIPQTLKITLKVVESLSEENLTLMLETQKEAAQSFNEWLEIYGRGEARQMTVNWLRTQTNVQETGISDDGTIWILFTNGIEGDIETYPPETLGGEESDNLLSPSGIQKIVNKINAIVSSGLTNQNPPTLNQPKVVGNNKVIILDPFLYELSEGSPQSYVYSKISPLTDAIYLKNEEVTIDAIKTLYEYGVVNITTHGRLHRDTVGFLSGEKITLINIFFHLGDLRNKRLSIGWHGLTPYYEILPGFITNYARESHPQSLIYIGACQSLKNLTMANAFLERGSATYFGFTRITSALFNKEVAKELFTNLVNKRRTTGEAFTNGLDPYWPGPDPEYGYESEAAEFKMVGESDLTLLLITPPGLANTPWPMFQHDARHTGQSEYVGSQTGNVKWQFVLEGKGFSSSPVIGVDGNIYVGGSDGKLYALSPDGNLEWTYKISDYWIHSTPAIAFDGTIYVGSREGIFYAINSDGTLKWSYSLGGEIFSSPAIGVDGTIYVGTGYPTNKLYAINPDGSLKWDYEVGGPIYSSPAFNPNNDVIYVGSMDYKLYAFNLDGTLKWSYSTGKDINSSPAIALDGTIYIGSDDYKLYAINPDGTLKWSYYLGWGYPVRSTPAIGPNNTIYITSGISDRWYLYAISPDGTLKWKYRAYGYLPSPIVGLDGTIYVGGKTGIYATGIFYAIASDGSLKWSKRFYLFTPIEASAAISSNGTVYIGTLGEIKGYFYAFSD